MDIVSASGTGDPGSNLARVYVRYLGKLQIFPDNLLDLWWPSVYVFSCPNVVRFPDTGIQQRDLMDDFYIIAQQVTEGANFDP
jgi:hypothetical protein